MSRKKDFIYVSGKRYDGMMGRCYREADPSYKNYGGRNIRVSSICIKDINMFRAWLLTEMEKLGISVEDFVKNSKSIQLERKEVNKHYTPENCTLMSPQGNIRNRRNTVSKVMISAEGEEIAIKPNYNKD